MSENIKATTEVLLEKPLWLRFGLLFVCIKPATLAQMYEVGSLVENMDEMVFEEKFNPSAKMFSYYRNIRLSIQIILILLFRSTWKRILFGWYVKRHLTMSKYRNIIEYSFINFQAGFFLTSSTFLKGVKETTKTTNTPEATPHGDLLEE